MSDISPSQATWGPDLCPVYFRCHAANHVPRAITSWKEPEPLEREPRFYSGTKGRVETVHASDARGRTPRRATTPPPPPTVEDCHDDEFADEQPKCPGGADQHPLIIDNENYINYSEQRFVLVSNPGEKPAGRNERTERAGRAANEPADRGRQVEREPEPAPSTPPAEVGDSHCGQR